MRKWCAVAVATFAASPSIASDWRFATGSDMGDSEAVLFIDAESRARTGNAVRFWLDIRLAKPVAGTNRFVAYVSADCSERTYKFLSRRAFLGAKFVQDMPPVSKPAYASPDSAIWGAIDAACTGNYRSMTIEDVDGFAAEKLGQSAG